MSPPVVASRLRDHSAIQTQQPSSSILDVSYSLDGVKCKENPPAITTTLFAPPSSSDYQLHGVSVKPAASKEGSIQPISRFQMFYSLHKRASSYDDHESSSPPPPHKRDEGDDEPPKTKAMSMSFILS
ncbi:hypothetical protein LEN26_001930 [Aphanomyces euteiches]|nr:hypothetical protein AeMF1_005323 [Aphanomyces euteiches]KAH9160291.1 hypothetical protein LEN26_001930 [Aphanomyces euteiches]KAH9187041.1 hypothetical protein AeNC1_010982 [Aphanomyces euteiches]